VPVKNADWPKFVQGLRDAGMVAYKAAQTKNQDKMLDAADAVTTACMNCHVKYRDVSGGLAARCM
jgi:cytochrome c556